MVDPGLRVHRVERLHVADASIMPQVPGRRLRPPAAARPIVANRTEVLWGRERFFSFIDRRPGILTRARNRVLLCGAEAAGIWI